MYMLASICQYFEEYLQSTFIETDGEFFWSLELQSLSSQQPVSLCNTSASLCNIISFMNFLQLGLPHRSDPISSSVGVTSRAQHFPSNFVPIPRPYPSAANHAHPCPPMLFKLRPCIQKLCNVYYPPTPSFGWIRQIKSHSLSWLQPIALLG